MLFRYCIIKKWCDAPPITEALHLKNIPFATYVISQTTVQIEINPENLPAAREICDGWQEMKINYNKINIERGLKNEKF